MYRHASCFRLLTGLRRLAIFQSESIPFGYISIRVHIVLLYFNRSLYRFAIFQSKSTLPGYISTKVTPASNISIEVYIIWQYIYRSLHLLAIFQSVYATWLYFNRSPHRLAIFQLKSTSSGNISIEVYFIWLYSIEVYAIMQYLKRSLHHMTIYQSKCLYTIWLYFNLHVLSPESWLWSGERGVQVGGSPNAPSSLSQEATKRDCPLGL